MLTSTIQQNVSLKKHNTFGLDVSAQYFVEINNLTLLRETFAWAKQEKLPVTPIGGGSNVLLTDDVEGLVILNVLKGVEITHESNTEVILKLGAGETWHEMVMYAVEQGWGGIENLSLIPGSVGAAPMQNIGAYGVELKDVFVSLEALNLGTLTIETFAHDDCQFGYRESIFKNHLKGQYFITSVTLRLSKEPVLNTSYGAISEVLSSNGISTPTIKDVSDAVIAIRQSKLPDPKQIGNSGSFFKNPVIYADQFENLKERNPDMPHYDQPDGSVKIPAGWLIEKCEWKGKRRGAIGVHEQQALVLVNYGGGSGAELLQLAKDIQQTVKERFGVALTPEVNVV